MTSPASLIAAVPYLLGFHPSDSIVAVGLSGDEIAFAARVDLPPPDVLSGFATTISRYRPEAVVLVGYGTAARVEPALGALERAMHVPVCDVFLVTDGRFRSCHCDDPECCPPEGRPVDAPAVAAAVAGTVVFADREALRASIAPLRGADRAGMRRATAHARDRLARLDDPVVAADAAVRSALDRHRAGRPLRDRAVAWLSVLIGHADVQDQMIATFTDAELHETLWAEVVRRAEPDLVADAAGMLAFAAYRAGNGALASIAVERALLADPRNPLARLMDQILAAAAASSFPGDPAPGQRRRRRRKIRT